MKHRIPASAFLAACAALGIAGTASSPAERRPTFADDLAFLRAHGPVQVLSTAAGGAVAVSAKYQGRVMTSAIAPDALSLGWVNRDFIAAGKTGTAFDNYGGEDRFWLGPEAGQFGLYFPPGAPFALPSWQVPAALQEGEWTIADRSADAVTVRRAMQISNYSGTAFDLQVDRTVRPLAAAAIAQHFGMEPPPDVRWVAFESVNQVTNTGQTAWTKGSGLPSIWILGMFNALGSTTVIVPFNPGGGEAVVNDRYFGKVPDDRLRIRDGYLLFSADGRYRSKIGIGPKHAKPVMGSYNREARLLTLVHFDRPAGAADYVNSMWEQQKDPYAGDVVNSYNDGPPNAGGWYELESSSPGLALRPGERFTHSHRTVHIVGPESSLEVVASEALGIPRGTLARLP